MLKNLSKFIKKIKQYLKYNSMFSIYPNTNYQKHYENAKKLFEDKWYSFGK